MPSRNPLSLPYSEVTPRRDYLSRRSLIAAAALPLSALRAGAATKLSGYKKSGFSTSEKQDRKSVV